MLLPSAEEVETAYRLGTPAQRAQIDALLTPSCEAYASDPAGYARAVLGIRLWAAQARICRDLVSHKRVFVKAAHAVGKTHVAAALVNWFFDCFTPGVCITTAPTQSQVVDVLWRQIRALRAVLPEERRCLMPREPRLDDRSRSDHYAVGYTAFSPEAFQGRHAEHVLIVFDECVGVDAPFWDAAEGMMTGGADAMWLAVCNPTDTTSRAWQEAEQTGRWHVTTIPALEHPNIAAELRGRRAPIPGAVRLDWVRARVGQWCSPVRDERRPQDFEFPPGSGNWRRPGPEFESRVLGRWPTGSTYAIWSEALWSACLAGRGAATTEAPEIGCDVARFGDDYTSIVARQGPRALHHETHNGWSTAQVAGRLKELARDWAARTGHKEAAIAVKIDDAGVGGGVVDQAGEFNFIGVAAAGRAREVEKYPNVRSELWFATAQRAAEGRLDFSALPAASLALLRAQLQMPTWRLDAQGRRVVEAKEDAKKRLGRSPDDADALNVAFYGVGDWSEAAQAATETPRGASSALLDSAW